MSTAAFAQDYRGDRISTQGRITSITRDGDMYRVTLNHGGYTYMVPVATVQNRGLQVGDRVRLDGIVDGDLVTTDLVAMPGDARYIHDPEYRTVPYGSSGWLSATVVSAMTPRAASTKSMSVTWIAIARSTFGRFAPAITSR
jgi:hypothetical protein